VIYNVKVLPFILDVRLGVIHVSAKYVTALTEGVHMVVLKALMETIVI
jgi:hypothetical protein